MTPSKQELIEQLLAAPARLFAAEAALLNAQQAHRQAVEALADREASLRIEGLDGNSADVRQAQLRERTENLRADVESARATVEFLRLAAENERALFSSLRAAARLAAVEDLGMAEVLEQLAKLAAVQARANVETGRHLARLEETQQRLEETQQVHGDAICRLLEREGAAT
jgi:hypothetical protein